jgi:hypothetical protein
MATKPLPKKTIEKAVKRIKEQIKDLKAEGSFHDFQAHHQGVKSARKKADKEFASVDSLKKVVKKAEKTLRDK